MLFRSWAFGVHSIKERGSVLYAIIWRENARENIARQYFGEVILTSRKKGEFGYKNIGEDSGPFYYDCPAKMINELDILAPVDPDSNAGIWREECRKKRAARRVKK